jgi:arsenate reductase
MADRPYNVLFLCTGNSARSIMAEAILNRLGAGKFRAFSAGSHPKGHVHPETLRLLQSLGYDTSGCRSKSWSEFADPGAPCSISCLRSATTQRANSARCGPDSQ